MNTHPVFIGNIPTTNLVKLEISDACGAEISASTFVYITTDPIEIFLSADTALCENEQLVLNPIVYGGEGERKYFWNDQPWDQPQYKVTPSGNTVLKFRVEDACGNTLEKTCNVEVQKVMADFKFNYEDYIRPITNYSTPNVNCDWFFPNGTTSNLFEPQVDFEVLTGGGTHLLVRNEIGCEAETSKVFKPTSRIFIPNAFTPDGDGVNDVFKAEGEYIETFELMIFNQWGKMIFYSDDISKGWSGEGSDQNYTGQNNIYNYRYVGKDIFGNVVEGMGTVQLLR